MISTFGLVKKLQRRREIHKISQAVASDPSPSKIATLCDRVTATKGPREALEAAEQGLRQFPWSERLQVLAFRLAKAVARDEIDEITRAIADSPTPEAYGRLAERFRQLGDEDEVIRVCRECAARFPQNENAFLVEGRLRTDRYRRTGLARDGILAIEKLERAVVLNEENLRARQLLGGLYADIRAYGRALPHLRYLKMHGAPDERLQQLLADAEVAETTPESSAEIAAMFARAGEGTTRNRSSNDGTSPRTPEPELDPVLKDVRAMSGVREVAVTTRTSDGPADPDGTSLVSVAKSIFAVASESLVEMEMGHLRHAQISGPEGKLLLFALGSSEVSVLTEPRAASQEIRDRVLSASVRGESPTHGSEAR